MTIEEYEVKKNKILRINTEGLITKHSSCLCYEKCSKCKGAGCCQHFPCAFSPEEFIDINNIPYMMELFKSGFIVLAQLSKRFSYIRVRGKIDPPRIITNLSIPFNECSLLTDQGCLLDPLFRPTEGLLTMPHHSCEAYYGGHKMKLDWLEYRKPMKKLISACRDIYIEPRDKTPQDAKNYQKSIISL